MVLKTADIKRIVMVRLNPNDDILISIRDAVKESGVNNGIILNGLGSARSYHYHVVADNNLPPAEAFPKSDEPRDIIGLTGFITEGRVHAHITLSDDTKAEGGHLEEGTRVLTFTILMIADLGETDLRDWDMIGDL